jgi:hypothetical protein
MGHLFDDESERQQLRERLHRLLADARRHFPESRHLRCGWIRARMELGTTTPKVMIGCGIGARFPRTTREAVFL